MRTAGPRAGVAGTARRPRAPARGGPLFEALRSLRLELAREESVPPFIVASDRTLRDIAMLRPRTLVELTRAHGIGAAKAERYGRRILATVERATAP